MPDFGILLDPPLPSAPEESVSSSLALISCPNLEVPCESDTQMQELVSDRNSLLGFPILMKEDELKPEINGCVELVQKEDELKQLTPKSSDSDIQMQEIVSDRNSQLGFPILLKEDDLKLENNECVELEQKEDELKLLTPKSSESDTQMQEMVSDRESQLALPILLKEDELKPENNGCVELEQKDELKLENNGCGELGIRILIPKSSQSNTQTEELVSDPNSQRGFPILPKEDELKLENNGYGELGIRDLISKSSQSDTQMQELVSDRNPQLGFPNLQIEDELKPDNSGCIELEQKEDQLKLENNGCGDLGIRGLRSSGGGSVAKKSLDEFVKDWVERKVNAGVDKRNCVLPFLIHAPKSVECSVCQGLIFPGDEVECSVRDCMGVFHLECAKERLGLSSPKMFKCPQHVCYVCNKKIHLWRCIRCPLASHDKCAAFPEHVVHLNDQPGRVICWKHPSDWRLEKVNLFICSSTQFYFY